MAALLLALPTLIALWLVFRRETRRMRAIGAAAAGISTRDLTARIDTRDLPREVRPIADGINAALAELEQGFVRERLFSSMAAHELRTPLAVLTAHLDALPDDAAKGMLRTDARRMRSLVDDLMTFAHMAGRRSEGEEVDLVRVTREAIAETAHAAAQARVTLAFEAEAAASIPGAAAALRLAVRNLIRNAIQHSPPGATVGVTVRPGPEIVVEDAGQGVADADKPHIFQPFWRGLDRREAGSGLGLAIVREVAAAHGGRVFVEDAGTGGARFVLSFGDRASS